ncbi:heterokaryon incompatibility protein-domain-containing protein [Tricladium varicosporioides]|nr:heterokaryon incompatibility protein-domain-containing protein [Hymenoscyphus varicosporioides]
MLCTACRQIDIDNVLEEGGHQLHASYNALVASATRGCTLCNFLKEVLPLYKRDLSICEVQRVDVNTEEWLGGAETAYEPLPNLFPMKKYGKKLAAVPVVLRVHAEEITNSIETGIRTVQIAVPDFHRHEDMRFDVYQEIELYAHEDDPAASVIRGRPIKEVCASDEAFTLATSWLEECLEGHEICGSGDEKPLPTRVLDLTQMDQTLDVKLHESKGRSGHWLALSHCWGKSKILTTTVQTFKAHTKRIKFESLPLNFQDDITIARKLGYQYLWIDSLCIIQDSADDWRSEAARMRDVYQNATLTIMAEASSEAGSGIFLSGDSKRNRQINAITIPYEGEDGDIGQFFVRKNVTSGLDSPTPLRTRGWVLQEDLLSPRILKYSSEQMFWACRSLRCCEADPTTDRRLEDIFTQRRPIDEVAYTNLSEYETPPSYLEWWYSVVVDDFTHRSLTIATDALPATGGIARQVQTGTGFTYLSGLWLEDIQRGLMWISCGQGKRNVPYSAPTWSWASMTFELGEREWIYDYIHVMPSWEYDIEIISPDIKTCSDDVFGQVEPGSGLRVRGYWRSVDQFHDCPRAFWDNHKDRRLLYQRRESFEYHSTEFVPKQIICSHDTVSGVDGVGPDISGKGVIYLMILKSDFPSADTDDEDEDEGDGEGLEEEESEDEDEGEGRDLDSEEEEGEENEDENEDEDEDEDEDEGEDEGEGGESEFEGTIYALILEPGGSRNTYRRIGVAQIPEDDGMAEGWEIKNLTII